MDRPAAVAILAAVPILALVFYAFTRLLPPFWGYGAALAFYWICVLLPLILWRGGFARARFAVTRPSTVLTLLNIGPIIVVACVAAYALSQNILPAYVLIAVALAALTNGTLEEVFWRGTLLLDDATANEQIGQIVLFSGWHIALLFAGGVVVTGGGLALLAGAAFFGILWTLARMQTGAIGFGILCHVALNVFAFTELATQNVV
ncbi:CPBP family glutamic-type intramembrane protease [Loktanella sp. Alg231-35]|uniref:CPBP family glutamic-type intramembrane protease n=1 Tax=Loktanella sp. Alg231-35 TaxID=1922220 RepID=UPI000D55128A|nr:CPBP family glutamic-type intramembrane protease [Loktanella sp. Alg231-35]